MITIIPAIDLIGGRCVRLSQGDYSRRKEYTADPVDAARAFEAAGVRRLHLVDLDGTRAGSPQNLAVLERIAVATGLQIDYGGGIRKMVHARLALEAGAAQITAGSIAVKNPGEVLRWGKELGRERIIIGADVRQKKLATDGWQHQTATDLDGFLQTYGRAGFKTVICTDIERDGMLGGPATTLYGEIKIKFPELRLIASGGVSGIGDVEELQRAGLDGVIIGKALYEKRITLKQLERFLC